MTEWLTDWMKQRFWAFEITLLAVVAYFTAEGVGTLVLSHAVAELTPAKSAMETGRASVHPKLPPLMLQEQFHLRMGEPLLRRNIFDSKTGPIDRDAADRTEGEDGTKTPDPQIIPCENTGIQVQSTVASSDAPEWSFVTLNDKGQRKFLRIGDKLNDKEVAWISWQYLFLQDQSDVCYIDLFGTENLAPRGRTTAPGRRVPSSLTRAAVQKMLRNPTRFAKQVRFRPKRSGGKVIGYEIRRLSRSGSLSRIGLIKRDVVKKINGVPLTSTARISDAFARIQKANSLHFSVLRHGAPVEINIPIR